MYLEPIELIYGISIWTLIAAVNLSQLCRMATKA